MSDDSRAANGEWDAAVIEEFRANGGRVGGPFDGVPIILIHHVGAKSGTERVAPLVTFPQDDGTLLIVAAKAGAPNNPGWYHNLKANPKIDVEMGTESFAVEVEEIVGAERERVWAELVVAMSRLDGYQSKTSRTIPVLRLTRTG